MTSPLLHTNVHPDCQEAHEAMAKLTEAILAVPDDAVALTWSFGQRHESAGAGWYWGVQWTLGAGSTEQRPRPVDRRAQLAQATKDMLDTISASSAT